MKMNHSLSIALISAFALCVSACMADSLKTARYEETMSVPLAENALDSLDIQISLEYPVAGLPGEVQDQVISHLLLAAFDVDYATSNVDTAAVRYRNDLIEEYYEEQEQYINFVAGQDALRPNALFRWKEYIKGYFLKSRYKNYLSYVIELERDRGGAHPFRTVAACPMDRQSGAVVKLEDLFKEGYEDPLKDLLQNHLPQALAGDEDALSAVYPDALAGTDNFAIDKEGITFYYNPNEIAMPFLGLIAIRIPWTDLDNILKP